MDLKDHILRDVRVAVVDSLVLHGNSIRFGDNSPGKYLSGGWRADWIQRLLKLTFEKDLLRPDDFRDAVILGVHRCGMAMYYVVRWQVVKEICDQTAVESPAALAYLMNHDGGLTPEQQETVRLYYGDAFEQFQFQAVGLIDDIMRQLRAL